MRNEIMTQRLVDGMRENARNLVMQRDYLSTLLFITKAMIDGYYTAARKIRIDTSFTPNKSPDVVLGKTWGMMADLDTEISRELDQLMRRIDQLREEIKE